MSKSLWGIIEKRKCETAAFGVVCLCSVALFAGCSQKSDAPVAADSPIDESNVRAAAEPVRSSPGHVTSVVWGDTRLHTSDSADAFGNRLGAEEALRFARGEEVTSTPGLNAQLKRPLDLLVIADDAVGLGIGQEICNANPALISDPQVKRWSDMLRAGGQEAQKATRQITSGHSAGTNPRVLSDPTLVGPISMGVWRSRGEVVERYNEPGQFTAFIGDEFTPAATTFTASWSSETAAIKPVAPCLFLRI